SLIVQDRMPSQAVLDILLERFRKFSPSSVADTLLDIAKRIVFEPAFAAEIYSTPLPDAADSSSLAVHDRLFSNLERDGLRLHDQGGSDVVEVTDSLPDENHLISILRSERAMNFVVILKEGVGNPSAVSAIEDNVNRALGAQGERKRFRLVPAGESFSLMKALNKARQFLTELHGKGETALWSDRVVYVLPESLEDRRPFVLKRTIRHSIPSADPARLGKEWLLLKSASEISQDSISPALKAFLQGKDNHLTFNDQAIPSAWLAHFAQAEAEIAALFAAAA
ncbi:MAG: hypothetical protein WCU74_04225, partial [Candidatus Omnitrophota bacterium]